MINIPFCRVLSIYIYSQKNCQPTTTRWRLNLNANHQRVRVRRYRRNPILVRTIRTPIQIEEVPTDLSNCANSLNWPPTLDGVAIGSTHQRCIPLDYRYLFSNHLHTSHTRPPLTYWYHRGIQHDAHTASMLVTKTPFLNKK